jgi:hypothetical protein
MEFLAFSLWFAVLFVLALVIAGWRPPPPPPAPVCGRRVQGVC